MTLFKSLFQATKPKTHLPKFLGEWTILYTPKFGMKTLRAKLVKDLYLRISYPPHASVEQIIDFTQTAVKQIEAQRQNSPQAKLKVPEAFKTHSHTVQIKKGFQAKASIRQNICHISIPNEAYLESHEGKSFLDQVMQTVWKLEAKDYIPKRVAEIAAQFNISYGNVTIRPNRTRWGSCSSKGDLNFSLYLMALDFDLVDYVICHELAHIQEKHHGALFWLHLESICPGAKSLDKRINQYQLGSFAIHEKSGQYYGGLVSRHPK